MKSADQFADMFREETGELLVELETTILALEERPDDADLVARVFRALHTVKGSAAMFGFEEIASFTHELEAVFDLVRAGELPVTTELVEVALRAKDLVRAMFAGSTEERAAERDSVVLALRRFPGPIAGKETAGLPPAREDESAKASGISGRPLGAARTFRIRIRPHGDLLQDGTDPIALLDEIRGFGPCQVIARTDAVPQIEEMDPETCYVSWDVILTTEKDEDALRDVFIFVEDHCGVQIDLLDDGQGEDTAPDYKKVGEILLERGEITTEQLREVLASQKRIGTLLEEKGLVAPEAVRSAVLEQQAVRAVRTRRQSAVAQAESASSIRVAAEKLDGLVNRVGELVIAQARLTQIAAKHGHPELTSLAEEIERLSAELRDTTLHIRMVPIGTTFGRFKRLVRDISAELGKEIDLVTEGAETELDKTVIEQLGDPLVHLIRNSCDHGIEVPEVRLAVGKPPQGTVRLAACHCGPNVLLEIHDDGAGVDAEAVRQKGVERGLISAEARLSDRELFNLVFLPGFSTAKQVSNLSGRGVGLDVVKRFIEQLRGSMEIESARGAGTRIRIKLPLTLAIIEGLLVVVGTERYVLPLSLVEGCVELTREDVRRAHGNRLTVVRGEQVPFLRLREYFGVEGDPPAIEQIAIANVEGKRFGFVVDEVIGQRQTVIKSLGGIYRHARGLSGATILGDGTVALILDAPALMTPAAVLEAAA